ncbi:hypothetical protein SAMN05444172_1601 [Burkholderia sp. GAS332]|nr:hypothetical protein SAMN05444172_1601 [Burkholderia sp. GAS332]
MAEVKIGVGAGVAGVDQAISKITQSMNKLGSAVAANQKLRFEPTDVKTMARDLDLINKQFKQTLALSAQIRNALKSSGQNGLHLSQVDWSKTSTDPRAAQRMRDRAFMHSVRGTSLDPTLFNDVDDDGNALSTAKADAQAEKARSREEAADARAKTRAEKDEAKKSAREDAAARKTAEKDPSRPGGFGRGVKKYAGGMAGRTAGAFGGGVGGPVGGILQEGIGGAGSGMEAGGLMGGLGGGLAGLAGGALIAGAAEAGKAISEGIDQAKDRNLDLDTLKRTMGDLGVSFDGLSDASWRAAQGLGMANGEFVKMEQLASASSGGAYRTPDEVATNARSGVDLARAYGLQPGQGVAFMSGMQRLNSRQNNKELATALAEAITNAQGKATASEVMQAMQGFAAAQNRFNSGSVDLNRFGNAYSRLLSGDGMTADHASAILGQANSAMQQMGGTEAAKNFTMQAFGSLDPIRAAMRAEGGLFGNGLDNRDIAGYMSQHGVNDWDSRDKGPDGTNFSVMRGMFDRTYAGRGADGPELELDAEKNYFGLKSLGDTASFMNMSDSDHNGIAIALKNAGVDLKDVREGGIQTISGISKAGSFGDLDSLYRSGPDAIRNRKDLSSSDTDALDHAEKSGGFQQFQNELVRVMAGKGQEDDPGSTQRSIDANISDIKTQMGQRLVPLTQAMMNGILAMANKIPGVHVQNPEADGGDMFVGPSSSAMNPNTKTGHGVIGGGAGSAASPAPAPGGSTEGGNGSAKYIRPGTTDTSDGDLAGFANGVYGAAIGGAYEVNDSVIGGMNQLSGMGVDKDHSAAIMASAIRESSMNPDAGSVGSYGLFQFDKTRAADFQKVMGKSLYGSSASEQIDYMVRSMKKGGEEAGPGAAFWASDGKDAARVFSDKVERPKEKGKEGDIRSGIASELMRSNVGALPAKVHASDKKSGGAIEVAPKRVPLSGETVGAIIEIPPNKAPEKIPEKFRARAAASAEGSSSASAGSGSRGTRVPNGDIVINLSQNVTTPGGQTKTKTLSTKVAKPSASGLSTPTSITLPGTN